MGDQLFLYSQHKSIPPHIVYNQIKEVGQDENSLGCPHICLEVGAVVPVFMGTNLLTLPKFYQDPAHLRPSAVAIQGSQDTAPVHSVIGFAEV